MDVLEATSSGWTRASMVFDATDGVVYLALERDYSRVYRVSIEDAVVETYSSFDESESWPIHWRGLPTAILSGESKPSLLERVLMFLGRAR